MEEQHNSQKPDEEVISLVDILKVLLKRKWLIIGGVLISIALIGLATKILPKKYCVNTVIEIGQRGSFNKNGLETRDFLEKPETLAAKIISAYAEVARIQLMMPEKDFPEVKTTSPKNTSIVTASIDVKKSDKGDQILKLINERVLEDHKALINENIANLKGQISKIDVAINEMKNNIDFLKDALKRLSQEKAKTLETFDLNIRNLVSARKEKEEQLRLKETEKKTLEGQLKETRSRLEELYALKDKATKGVGSGEGIGLLLFANEISTRQRYADDLDERVNVTLVSNKTALEQNIEELKNNIQKMNADKEQAAISFAGKASDLQEKIAKAGYGIQNNVLEKEILESLLGTVRETKILKQPTYCEESVTSARKNGAIAGAIAFFFFTFLAFFLEFLEKHKRELWK